MFSSIPTSTLEKFTTFGDLLRFLRRRTGMTQTELSIAVGYSTAQISRLEQNLRLPDIPTIQARFVSALDLEDESQALARLLELAAHVRREDAPVPGLCPYKGLNYFDEADTDLFVGREALTAKLTDRLLSLTSNRLPHETRFLAVIGASGCGKSSLIRAGIVPSLRWNKTSSNWHIHILTPTAHPLESLAESLTREGISVSMTANLMDDLARDARALHLFARRELRSEKDSRLLLVVDQFEELFAVCCSDEEKTSFVGNLLTAASEADGPTVVLITLRADFYAHCADHPQLREVLTNHQEYIGSMTSDELRRAIEEPAGRGRWEFEPGLVELMLHDVGNEPGALPLLSHALLETWQRRRGRMMTLGGYASSGGVRGAIAETAESVFSDQFTKEQQILARRIFLRLTELGDNTSTGDTRRQAKMKELILKPEDAELTRADLEALADARLVTTTEDAVEVAHEALIREWPTLRSWLEDNREALRLHKSFTAASLEWSAVNRQVDMLFRGARLTQTREWAETHAEDMNDLERDFLTASIQNSEREMAEREAQHQRELEAARKLAETEKARAQEQALSIKQLHKRAVYLFAVLAFAVMAAIVAGVFANQNGTLASTNASIAATAQAESAARATHQAIAEENFTRAESQRLAAEANVLLKSNGSPELIALLSIHAMNMQYSPQGDAALSGAAGLDYPLQVFTSREDYTSALNASPDGRYVASAQPHDPENILHLWDVESGKEIQQFVHGPSGQDCCGIYRLTFSPDSRYVFTHMGVEGDTFRGSIWDIQSSKQVFQLTQPALCNRSLFSADDKYLTVGCEDNTVQVWDWQASQLVSKFLLPSEQDLVVLYISSDTQYVVSRLWFKWGRTMQVWKLGDTVTKISEFPYSDDVTNFTQNPIMVSPDGRYILVGDLDGTTHLMDTTTGDELDTFKAKGMVMGVDFSPDGDTLLVSSMDQFVRLYDRQTGEEIRSIPLTDWAWQAAFSPDGKFVLTGSDIGLVRVWDVQPQPHLPVFIGHTDAISAASFSPDGQLLATSAIDGLRLWQSSTGQLLRNLPEAGSASGTEFSADGRYLLSGNLTGVATMWNVETGRAQRQFIHPSIFQIYDMAFSPDGRSIMTAGTGPGTGDDLPETIWVWDLRHTAEPALKINTGGHPIFQAVFSPDGQYILGAVGNEPVARLWEAKTGSLVREFTGHEDVVLDAAFSPDGKIIATSSSDNTVRLWNAQTGQEIRQFLGHIEAVWGVEFSPDGKTLLSGSLDGTVRLWDMETGKELRRMVGHTAGVESAIFSPDGKFIVSVSDDGTARLWDADYHDTMDYLCSRLLRDFTDKERIQYGISDNTPTCLKP